VAKASREARARAKRKRDAARRGPAEQETKTTALAVPEPRSEPSMALAPRRAPKNARKLWEAATARITPLTRKAYAGEWRRFATWWEEGEDGPAFSESAADPGHAALLHLCAFPGPYEPREIILRFRSYLDFEKVPRGTDMTDPDPRLGVAPATRARAIRAINSMVKKLNFVGYVPWTLDVPAGGVQPRRNVKGPTQEVWLELLNHVKTTGTESDLALLHALRTIALRASEACKVRIADLKATDQTLDVIGKGGKLAHLPMPESVWRLFTRVAKQQAQEHDKALYLFGHPREGISYQKLYDKVVGWGAALDIKLWPHALRHSGITRAAGVVRRGDMGVKELQAFSRHSRAETALGYIDALDNAGKKIADGMVGD
jgi:integrase